MSFHDEVRSIINTLNCKGLSELQDPETVNQKQTAIGLLKLLAQGEEDVLAGRTKPQEEMFSRLERLTRG